MPDEKVAFDVFLSHNSKDKPVVRLIAEALKERRLRVWLDEWELIPGRRWIPELEKAIETTKAAAVVVGESGFGRWEQPEYEGALSEFVDRGLPVIPVLLPGAPEQPKLPLFLRGFTWVDLRSGLTQEGLDLLAWGITGRRPQQPTRSLQKIDYSKRPHIFISYCRKDEFWKNRLVTHLGVLEQENLLEVWSDQEISAGSEWPKEIEQAIDKSSVAVLLISADFLASQFIRSKEVPRILERRNQEGMTIYPIIIGSCAWRRVNWLSSLQIRPADSRPLASRRGDRIDAELSAIVEEIADSFSH